MGKEINSFELIEVPEGIEASVKARAVTVKGARGTLTKEFKHLAVDIYMPDAKTIKVEKWFGKKKQIAAVRTVCSHIKNMFKGLTLGYLIQQSTTVKNKDIRKFLDGLYVSEKTTVE